MNPTKLISMLISLCFLHSFVVAPAVQATLQADLSLSGAQPEFEKLFMPSSAGRITASRDFGTKTVVINIQDFHCHAEVQRNISRILESLDRQYGLNEVYVEGGYGDVDTSWLAAYPDGRAKKGIADALVNGGRLTGSEYYSVIGNKPRLLKGLEDEQLHRENVARLGKILTRQGTFDATVRRMDNDITFLQAKYLNNRNRKLNAIIDEHRAGKLSSEKYYLLLMKYADVINARPDDFNAIVPPRRENYPNIVRYLETLECGRRLRYARISGQLQVCIRELKSVLPYSRYQRLLKETDNFSDLEKLYVAISALARENRIRISGRYPDLQAFLACTDKSRSINPVLLLEEEKQLVEALRVALSEDSAEMQVSFLVDFYGTFRDYLSQKLTADDYGYFVSRVDRFRELWAKYTYVNHLDGIKEELSLLDEYYRANVQRNYAFIDHLFKPEEVAAAGQEQGKVLVTVTGGFHSEGLQRLLEEKKISYVTITPNVTADIGQAGAVYLDLIRSQAKEFNANALAARLGSSSGAKIIPDTADPRAFKISISENIFTVRREDNGEYALEGMLGTATGKEYIDLKESITDALKMTAQIEKTFNPLRTAELIDALTVITGKWAAERGIIAGHGLIFEIAMDNDVQEALKKRRYSDALPRLELNDIARLPDNLQQTYVNGVLRQEKREKWQKEGKELLIAVSMVPGLISLLLVGETFSESSNKPSFNNGLLFSALPFIFLAGNSSRLELGTTEILYLIILAAQLVILSSLAYRLFALLDIGKGIKTIAGNTRGLVTGIIEQGLSASIGKLYRRVKNGVAELYRDTVFVVQKRIEKSRDRRDPVKRQQRQQRLNKLVEEEAAKLIDNTGKTDTDNDALISNIYFGRPFAELRAYWRESIWDYILLAALILENIVDFNNYVPAVLLLIPVVKTIQFRRDGEAKIIGRKAIFFHDPIATDETLTRTFITHELTHRIFPKRRQAYLASYFEYLRMQELGKATQYSHAASEVRSLLEHPGEQDLKNVNAVEKAILRRSKEQVSGHGFLERLFALQYEPIYTYYYGHMMAAYVVDRLFKGDIRKAYLVGQYLGEGAKFSDAVKAAGYADASEPETPGIRDRLSLIVEKGKQTGIIIPHLAVLSFLLYGMTIIPSRWYGIVVAAFIIKDVKVLSMLYDLNFGDILSRLKDRVKDLTSNGGSLFSVLPFPLVFMAASNGSEWGFTDNVKLVLIVSLLGAAAWTSYQILAPLNIVGKSKSIAAKRKTLALGARREGGGAIVRKLAARVNTRVNRYIAKTLVESTLLGLLLHYIFDIPFDGLVLILSGIGVMKFQDIVRNTQKYFAVYKEMRDPVKKRKSQEVNDRLVSEAVTNMIKFARRTDEDPAKLKKSIYVNRPFIELKAYWKSKVWDMVAVASVMLWSLNDQGNLNSDIVTVVPLMLIQSIKLLTDYLTPFGRMGSNINNTALFVVAPYGRDEAKISGYITHEIAHKFFPKKNVMYLGRYFQYLRWKQLGKDEIYSTAGDDVQKMFSDAAVTDSQNVEEAAAEILRRAKKKAKSYSLLARISAAWTEPQYNYPYGEMMAYYVVEYLFHGEVEKAYEVGTYLGQGDTLRDALIKAKYNGQALTGKAATGKGSTAEKSKIVKAVSSALYLSAPGLLLISIGIIILMMGNPGTWRMIAITATMIAGLNHLKYVNNWEFGKVSSRLKGMAKKLAKNMKLKSFANDEEASFSFLSLSGQKRKTEAERVAFLPKDRKVFEAASREVDAVLMHYIPPDTDMTEIKKLIAAGGNTTEDPVHFAILPQLLHDKNMVWENLGIKAEGQEVWATVLNGIPVIVADGIEPRVTGRVLRETLSSSGRWKSDRQLSDRLTGILEKAGIPAPRVYDLSLVIDHTGIQKITTDDPEEINFAGNVYAAMLETGKTPMQIVRLLRERKIAERRQSKEKLYFRDGSETPGGLIENMELLKGSDAGNIIVRPEIFNRLPTDRKQRTIDLVSDYIAGNSRIKLFVDLSGIQDRQTELDAAARQYLSAGFAGYATVTADGMLIQWFEGKKVLAQVAPDESYKDLATIQGSLKSALNSADAFVFDIGMIRRTIKIGRGVDEKMALAALLDGLLKDDPASLQAQIEKQMKGLDPLKLQKILSAA